LACKCKEFFRPGRLFLSGKKAEKQVMLEWFQSDFAAARRHALVEKSLKI
jgi:hypothetical protein